MPSIGEADVAANSRIIGTVRVATIQLGGAVYPRLDFRTEWSLRNLGPGDGGPVHVEGQPRTVRSSNNGFEQPLDLVVDLDLCRIEAIERTHGSALPTL